MERVPRGAPLIELTEPLVLSDVAVALVWGRDVVSSDATEPEACISRALRETLAWPLFV